MFISASHLNELSYISLVVSSASSKIKNVNLRFQSAISAAQWFVFELSCVPFVFISVCQNDMAAVPLGATGAALGTAEYNGQILELSALESLQRVKNSPSLEARWLRTNLINTGERNHGEQRRST